MPGVEIKLCRWDPSKRKQPGNQCESVNLGSYKSVEEAQEDDWDITVFEWLGEQRVGLGLPSHFGKCTPRVSDLLPPNDGAIDITFETCCGALTVQFGAGPCGCEELTRYRATCVTCGSTRVCGQKPQCHE